DIGKRTRDYWQRLMSGLADEVGFSMDTAFKDLPKRAKNALLHGKDFKVKVSYRNRWGANGATPLVLRESSTMSNANTMRLNLIRLAIDSSRTCVKLPARHVVVHG